MGDKDGNVWHVSAEEYQRLREKQDAKKRLANISRILRSGVAKTSLQEVVKLLLEACGYTSRGATVRIHPQTFFSIDCAYARFSMLDRLERQRIGSPERLLEICLQAWKRHKKLNALQKNNTFAECFKDRLQNMQVENLTAHAE